MLLNFSLGFLMKLALIVISASIFYRKRKKIAESLVCGWMVIYVGLIALLLVLSCFKAMDRTGILLGAGGGLAISLILCWRYGDKQCLNSFFHDVLDKVRHGDIISYIVFSGLLLLAAYIIGHNSLFFDSTWDAHTYQVPRIELFVQKESLFINMKSNAINIFSNEWNGELNAVFYAILCETNQGMFLANAENFVYSLLVVYWFCKEIRLNRINTILAIIGYCSMPVVVFLSMVVKGDFVTIPFFLTTVIWLKDYIESHSTYSLFFLITGGALAAGSKISMVPFLGLCFISVVVYLIVQNKEKRVKINEYIVGIWKVLLLGIVCAGVSCSRYFLNWFFYGNFFKRVESDNEKVTLSWQYFKASIVEIVRTLVDSDNMFMHEGTAWALYSDMGMVGSVFVILFLPTMIIWMFRSRKMRVRSPGKTCLYVCIPIIGSMLFLMASTIWYPWSFRYYIPWFLILFFYWLYMLQQLSHGMSKTMVKMGVAAEVWLGVLSISSTIVLTLRVGEVTHSSWKEAIKKPMIEREYGFHPYLLENLDGSPDIYDFFDQIRSEKKILICNALDTAVSYLFGEDNSNDVTFCIPSEIILKLSEEEYDVVSVSDVFLSSELETYFGNGEWICYTPANDILKAHVFLRTNIDIQCTLEEYTVK